MTRMLTWGARAGALLALGLLLAGCERAANKLKEEMAASQNPFPSASPLHDPADRMLRRLVNDERFLARAKSAQAQGQQANQVGAQLTMDGLGRLSLPELERRSGLMANMLEHMPVEECALIARTASPADAVRASQTLFDALEKQPAADIDFWFEMSYKASIAELSQTPGPKVSEQEVTAAMQALLASLDSDAERQRAISTLPAIGTAPAADACWVARTLFTAASTTLEEPQRGHLAWILTQR